MRSKAPVNILVINCGSSSLKYRIIRMPEGRELAGGEAIRVGALTNKPSQINAYRGAEKQTIVTPMPDHAAAFRAVIALLDGYRASDPAITYDCFAHRYVHPGAAYNKTVKINAAVTAKLKANLSLAPIHNKISLGLIESCAGEFKDIPQYAVFDTTFHKNIPDEYAAYALPEHLVKKYKLKKVGFHGVSHKFIMEESCRYLGRDYETQKIISCHLGSGGSSICAIRNGVSINTSMGFTPLEGLMMNTRSGDMDISVLFHVMAQNNLSVADAENLLNYQSGVLGVYNTSSDIRDVAKQRKVDPKANMVFEMYVRRVRKFICFYSLILQKADVLVFTDTLGVEMPELRQAICSNLTDVGIAINNKNNNVTTYTNSDITGDSSEVKVLVIPTNEELMIARDAYKESRNDLNS